MSEKSLPQVLNTYAYPNPFNSSLRLDFSSALEEDGTIEFYDIRGKTVGSYSVLSGSNNFYWTPSDLPSGVYLYRLGYKDKAKLGSVSLIK